MCNLKVVREIPSQKELWDIFDYNPETGELSRLDVGHVYGSRKNKNGGQKKYIIVNMDGAAYYAHRIIWTMVHGQIPEGMTVDHINLNGRDNRISNLRLATTSQQQQNRRPWSKTGYKGVYIHRGGVIFSSISVGGTLMHLGTFASIEEAAAVYEEAALKYRGQFAGPTSVASAA